jgi:nitrite reductase/ring-hydroxylating ferredoxin subunit
MTEHVVCEVNELEPGQRLLVELEGRDIAVFNVDHEFYAYTNWCVHQAGPVCQGSLSGTQTASFDPETLETEFKWEKEGEVLACPWHGWEYDVTTGDCLSRQKAKLVSHEVRICDDEVVVDIR